MNDDVPNKNLVSIVIPVYNAREGIAALVSCIIETAKRENLDIEIVLVNDNSTDNTWQLIKQSYEADKGRLRCFNLSKNIGQYAATCIGLNKAKGNLLITMDDDCLSVVDDVLLQVKKGHTTDLAYAKFVNSRRGLLRNIGSALVHLAFKSKIKRNLNKGSSIRLISKHLWLSARKVLNNPQQLDVALINNSTSVPVFFNLSAVQMRKSRYTLWKLVKLGVQLVFGISDNKFNRLQDADEFIAETLERKE